MLGHQIERGSEMPPASRRLKAPHRSIAIAVIAATALAVGGIAYATIPDSTGVIHGCFEPASGKLRVIDTDAGRTCRTDEASLTWNQSGPQGVQGAQGPPGPRGGLGPMAYVEFGNDEMEPNGQTLSAFVPTGSDSPACLVTLAESNFAVTGTTVYCGNRYFNGTWGIIVRVLFPSAVPSNDLILSTTVYQEGAQHYGAPVHYSGE
jgi:hypothetical protein